MFTTQRILPFTFEVLIIEIEAITLTLVYLALLLEESTLVLSLSLQENKQ